MQGRASLDLTEDDWTTVDEMLQEGPATVRTQLQEPSDDRNRLQESRAPVASQGPWPWPATWQPPPPPAPAAVQATPPEQVDDPSHTVQESRAQDPQPQQQVFHLHFPGTAWAGNLQPPPPPPRLTVGSPPSARAVPQPLPRVKAPPMCVLITQQQQQHQQQAEQAVEQPSPSPNLADDVDDIQSEVDGKMRAQRELQRQQQ